MSDCKDFKDVLTNIMFITIKKLDSVVKVKLGFISVRVDIDDIEETTDAIIYLANNLCDKDKVGNASKDIKQFMKYFHKFKSFIVGFNGSVDMFIDTKKQRFEMTNMVQEDGYLDLAKIFHFSRVMQRYQSIKYSKYLNKCFTSDMNINED